MHAFPHARSHSRGYDQWAGPRSCEQPGESGSHFATHPHQPRDKNAPHFNAPTAFIASLRSGITDDRWSAQARAATAAAAALVDVNTKLARPPLRACPLMRRNACIRNLLRAKIETNCSAHGANGLHNIMMQFLASIAVIRLRSTLSLSMGTTRLCECVRVCVQCDASINLPTNYCSPIWIDSQSHPDISVHTRIILCTSITRGISGECARIGKCSTRHPSTENRQRWEWIYQMQK